MTTIEEAMCKLRELASRNGHYISDSMMKEHVSKLELDVKELAQAVLKIAAAVQRGGRGSEY